MGRWKGGGVSPFPPLPPFFSFLFLLFNSRLISRFKAELFLDEDDVDVLRSDARPFVDDR